MNAEDNRELQMRLIDLKDAMRDVLDLAPDAGPALIWQAQAHVLAESVERTVIAERARQRAG